MTVMSKRRQYCTLSDGSTISYDLFKKTVEEAEAPKGENKYVSEQKLKCKNGN